MPESRIDAQVASLRDAIRKQVGNSRDMRACYRALCLLMILQGQRISDIAATLGEHTRTIERWRKRFNEHGVAGLHDDTSRQCQRLLKKLTSKSDQRRTRPLPPRFEARNNL